MRVADRPAYTLKKLEPFRGRQLAPVAVLVDRLALDVLHDKVRQAAIGAARIEQAGNVGMIEHRENLALAAKPPYDFTRVQPTANDLDGNQLLEGIVGARRKIDIAHAAMSDLAKN